MQTLDNYLHKIICADCLETIKQMSDKSSDLVVINPPYNLKNSGGRGPKHLSGGKWKKPAMVKGYSDYVDAMPNEKYHKQSSF